jgi:hypothetical protein
LFDSNEGSKLVIIEMRNGVVFYEFLQASIRLRFLDFAATFVNINILQKKRKSTLVSLDIRVSLTKDNFMKDLKIFVLSI